MEQALSPGLWRGTDRWWKSAMGGLVLLVVAFGVVLLGASVWLTIGDLERERAEVMRATEADADNLARAFEEHLLQTIRRLDQALIQLCGVYQPASQTASQTNNEAFFQLAARWQASIFADLNARIVVIGPDGMLRSSDLAPPPAPVDLSARETFQAVRDRTGDDMFIGKPEPGTAPGRWTIPLARRLRGADGSFGGVMILAIAPDTLSRFFRVVNVGAEGVIAVIGADTVIRARASSVPPPMDLIGSALPDRPFFHPDAPATGIHRMVAAVDGLPRISAWRRLAGYPLIAHVLLGEGEAMAGYEAHKREVVAANIMMAAFVAATMLAIAWLARLQAANQRMLERARYRLAQTEERWRLALEAVGDGVWDWAPATGTVFTSHSWKSMLGHGDDEISDRRAGWDERIHPDDRAAACAELDRHLTGAVPCYRHEHRMRRKDGSYTWILDRGVAVSRAADGTPLRVIGTHTDISQRKQVETTLAATAARLTAILDNVPVGIAILSPDRHIVLANPMMETIFGHSADRLTGASTRMFFDSDETFAAFGQQNTPSLMQGDIVSKEVRLRRGDGAPLWVRLVGRRVSPDDPSLGFVWAVDDINARKRAEQALEDSLKFQRVLIDTVPVPIFVKDAACRYADANATFLCWMGLDRLSLMGKTVFDVAPAPLAAIYHQADRDILTCPRTQVYEAAVRMADGTDKDVEFSKAVFFDGFGEPAGIVGAMVDITARKQAEQALRERHELFEKIFVSNHAVKLLVDPADGRIIDANPAAAAFYGWSLETLRTMRIADINTLPADEVAAEIARARCEERSHFLFQHRQASGAIRDVEVYSSPITVHGRTLLLSLIHDVTRRRVAEQALQEKTAELERSNTELEAFAYVTSHDLRQPLRTINTYLALMERDLAGKLEGEALQFFTFVRNGALRLDRMIRALLDYSRVGRNARPFVAVASADCVALAVECLDTAIRESAATVTVDPGLPEVSGDDSELVRLFQNLIGNALKYRDPARPPAVHIACVAEDEHWHFTVRDNGIGIAPAQFERIFGIFQRLHLDTEYEGAGVGLAICRKIVEHHSGRIWVESQSGAGSTFHFTVPRREAPAAL
jgi:PAS domain S-box-containing protein